MTISMPDSIRPGDLPGGYPAYLGYADGAWPTAAVLRVQHPGAHIVSLTVLNNTLEADGTDCEPGNGNAKSAAAWVQRKLAAAPVARPVVYASLAAPGYSMPEIVTDLAALGIARSRVRLLTAHYGQGEHICGPAACGGLKFDADGTQWTSTFRTPSGARIDMSLLSDGFFGTAVPAPQPITSWTEFDMAKLPVLQQGAADHPGAFFYVRRLQQLVKLTAVLNGLQVGGGLAVDGAFGPKTADAVRAVQLHYHIANDGIAGAQTWSVLLTGGALWAREARASTARGRTGGRPRRRRGGG